MNCSTQIITLSSSELILSQAETKARLGGADPASLPGLVQAERNLRAVMEPKGVWRCAPVRRLAQGVLDIGFGEIRCDSLVRLLEHCEYAITMAVTLGVGTDRLLTRLSMTSPAAQFLTDALASSAVEAAADAMQARIGQSIPTTRRFSPGYGSLPLEIQPALLEFLGAKKFLGLTLTKSMLMVPTKSVSAVMGVKQDERR